MFARRSIHVEVIADGVATARTTGQFGIQVVIRPVKRMLLTPTAQKKLDSF
jgi:hypothetical protein